MDQHAREQQQRHWDAVAGGWATWLEWTEQNFGPVTDWFVNEAGWAPGRRALDVACGAGYPALLGAARMCPGGAMVATDISDGMLATTLETARARGRHNVECVKAEAEHLRFTDASFDCVTNAYGLMFCPDPQPAIDEAYRVLKRGGRFAIATWDDPAKSPFFTVITTIAAPMLALAPPAAGAPGPFRLADASQLEIMLRRGGFSSVRVESRSATLELGSVEDYCRIFADVAWKNRMASWSRGERSRFQQAVREASRPFERDGQLRLEATSLCASGRKVGLVRSTRQ